MIGVQWLDETGTISTMITMLSFFAHAKRGTYFLSAGNERPLLFLRLGYHRGVILNYSIYAICGIVR
jgi:hypothetical protein